VQKIGRVKEKKKKKLEKKKIQAWEKKKESILKSMAETTAPSEEPAAP